jgi:hypothetical protein
MSAWEHTLKLKRVECTRTHVSLEERGDMKLFPNRCLLDREGRKDEAISRTTLVCHLVCLWLGSFLYARRFDQGGHDSGE